jgi:hypothetical protein
MPLALSHSTSCARARFSRRLSAVGRICDRPGRNRRAAHDSRHARGLDRAAALRGFDRFGKQPLHPFLTNALSPTYEARRTARQLVPEVQLAAKQIVRIFEPALHNHFVGQRVHVLQVQKPRHQPSRKRRSTRRLHELRAELPTKHRPVDEFRERHQLVPSVDDTHQFLAEQILDRGHTGGLARIGSFSRYCKVSQPLQWNLQSTPPTLARRSSIPAGLQVVQGRTSNLASGQRKQPNPLVVQSCAFADTESSTL